MVQFLSINVFLDFFNFVEFFKSSRFFCVTLYFVRGLMRLNIEFMEVLWDNWQYG